MSQAICDPDELDRFAQSLSRFIESLNDAVNYLNHDFSALGETWRDEKRTQFEEDYSCLLQQISNFESNATEQVPYLHTLASRLRVYLQS